MRVATLAMVGSLLGSTACGSSDQPAERPAGPVTNAYAALTAGEIERAPELTRTLDAHLEQRPDDGMATFYAGLMRFWHFAEGTPAAGENLVELGGKIVERIAHSRTFLPEDARVPGFLGLTRTIY